MEKMCFRNRWERRCDGKKKPDEEKICRWTEFLDNNKWKMHTGARARKQKYIYIYLYISLHENLFENGCIYMFWFS